MLGGFAAPQIALQATLLQAMQLATRCDYGRYSGAFHRIQCWMPDVADENDAQLVGRVKCFMLDSVVEYPCFAALPIACFACDAEPAAGGHNQGQVAYQTRISDARMRRYVRAGCE